MQTITNPPAVRRACPVCATITRDTFCPECKRVSLIITTLTYGQLMSWLSGNEAGSDLFRRALVADTGRLCGVVTSWQVG